MTRVLLTGASGYIGKHIALELLNNGYQVRASVRNLAKSQEVIDAVKPFLTDQDSLSSKLSFVELDLEKDFGWSDALNGIDVLMHTASPFPLASPKDENDLIRPAIDGTMRALRAAKASGVKRIILTSSIAAVNGCDLPVGVSEYNEAHWTDTNHKLGSAAYTKSKTMAERAAWDFVKNEAPEIELTTINPGVVFGAPLDNNFGSSVSVIERLLKGKDPMMPDLSFGIVDVKDVAKMHVQSINTEATKGERILAHSGSMSFMDMALVIKTAHPKSKIKVKQAPDFLIKILSLFDKEIKSVVSRLGRPMTISNAKAKALLGYSFIPTEVSVKETAEFLVSRGLVKI